MKTIKINGKEYIANENESILSVAKRNNIEIQTLCYIEECMNMSHCGVCLVEIEGKEDLVKSCSTIAEDGMSIRTNNERVQKAVKERVSELLDKHNFKCGECKRKGNCEFFDIVVKTNAKKSEFIDYSDVEIDDRSKAIVYDRTKCIHCDRCVTNCNNKSGTYAVRFENWDKSFDDTNCILCGQCVTTCPVDALYEKSHIERVKNALKDPNKHVIIAMAPSVRTALGEVFDMGFGVDVTKKVYTALRKIGFKKIFDVNFGADMTIVEESTELIERIKKGGPFPMYTSCCPGWIRLVENYYPELLDNISSAKSPQQMFGAATKTYYPSISGINPKDVFTVSIMPCTAKKFEVDRDEMVNRGLRNIDASLTTRELGRLIKEYKIDFNSLEESEVDLAMGEYTGAGTIFGATGGVMEAALRTTKDLVEGICLENVDYEEVRGLDNIKEATVTIGGVDYNIAVINGAVNFVEFQKSGLMDKKQYHFIEVMACSGGCVNGGGQPFVSSKVREKVNFRKLRASVLYNQDENLTYRKSHKNKSLMKMYENYIGEPGGEIAHELFHVHYNRKNN